MTEQPYCEIKFTCAEESDALLLHSARDLASLVFEIDQLCRSKLKYEAPSEDLSAFCEELRRMIAEEVDLDRIWR